MILNQNGKIADLEWRRSPLIRANIRLDEYIIMPNHIHGIIEILDRDFDHLSDKNAMTGSVRAYRDTPVRLPNDSPVFLPNNMPASKPNNSPRIFFPNHMPNRKFRSPSNDLGAIIRGYKAAVTTKINKRDKIKGRRIWHRNYYERIIRNEEELNYIREYIIANPRNWNRKKEII